MKRPLGWACLLFVLFIRLFYVCFPPSLPDYDSISGREVYINGQVISIKIQEIYGESQIVYTLSEVTMQERSAVSNDSYLSDKSTFALNTKENSPYQQEKIYCYTAQEYPNVHIGSWVWIKGFFEPYEAAENPGQFDSKFYYYIQGVGGKLENAVLVWSDEGCNALQEGIQKCKAFFTEKINTYFSEKYGGVMKTILLGDKTDLDKNLKKLYQEGGILHILTISGLHISMLGMGGYRLFRKVGVSQKFSAIIGLMMVLLYGAMIGTQAATFRAICMFGFQMTAILLGRTYDRLTGLSVAAVLLLLEQPMYIFYSGFLLSFGAVLGVTIVPPILEKMCKEKRKGVRWFIKQFSGGVSILLVTFPIQLCFYYEYSLYSMVINVLLLPLLPYVVALGLVILVLPQMAAVLAGPVVWGCEGVLQVYEWVCMQSQKLPYHSLVLGAPKPWQMVGYYVCLLVWIGYMKYTADGGLVTAERIKGSLEKQKRKRKKIIVCIGTFGIFLLSAVFLLCRPVEGLTCRFLSVGQGDCAVIQNGKQTYVVDCGSTSSSGAGTQVLLPCLKFYGVSKVDGVFISHADADHMNGIVQWLEEYEHSHVEIGNIILPSLTEENIQAEFTELLMLAGQYDIPVATLGAGDRLNLGELTIEVLHPAQNCSNVEDANGYSQVLLFQYEGQSVLMTGDIGAEQEVNLCDKIAQRLGNGFSTGTPGLAVLKAPHHGSKYSGSTEFLEVCNAQNIILSYGVGNSYGHPHREAVERMQEAGSELWYTGRQGAIECIVDENGVWIQGFR